MSEELNTGDPDKQFDPPFRATNGMTIEKAREILSVRTSRLGNRVLSGDSESSIVEDGILYGTAQGFLEGHSTGHASRDPEVEKLKATITELEIEIEDEKIRTRDVGNDLQAEREAVENIRADRLEALLDLRDAREASKNLVEAVKLVFDYQEAGIISLEPHRLALFYNALKSYTDATPGHSPEGKTL